MRITVTLLVHNRKWITAKLEREKPLWRTESRWDKQGRKETESKQEGVCIGYLYLRCQIWRGCFFLSSQIETEVRFMKKVTHKRTNLSARINLLNWFINNCFQALLVLNNGTITLIFVLGSSNSGAAINSSTRISQSRTSIYYRKNKIGNWHGTAHLVWHRFVRKRQLLTSG